MIHLPRPFKAIKHVTGGMADPPWAFAAPRSATDLAQPPAQLGFFPASSVGRESPSHRRYVGFRYLRAGFYCSFIGKKLCQRGHGLNMRAALDSPRGGMTRPVQLCALPVVMPITGPRETPRLHVPGTANQRQQKSPTSPKKTTFWLTRFVGPVVPQTTRGSPAYPCPRSLRQASPTRARSSASGTQRRPKLS